MFASPPDTPRTGSSLIEIMIAFAIMTTGLLVTMGFINTMTLVGDSTMAREARTIAMANLVNLYAGSSGEEVAYWNRTTNTPPTHFSGTDSTPKTTVQGLVVRGLLSPETGQLAGEVGSPLNSLRFTVGFYRAMSNTLPSGALDATRPGLWTAQTGGVMSTTLRPLTTEDDRNLYRITSTTDTGQLTEGNPYAVLVQAVEVDENEDTVRVLDSTLSVTATLLP